MDAGLRLGNPLANELLIGIGAKDVWNTQPPTADGTEFLNYFAKPLLPQLLPSLYPGVFRTWRATTAASPTPDPTSKPIFLTGIPAGVITQAPTFTNYNGTGVKAEMLRLNTAILPSSSPNSLGLLGLDVAGFPNGRRVFDDVATIAFPRLPEQPWVTSFPPSRPMPRPAWSTSGSRTDGTDLSAKGTEDYLYVFPYLGTPYSGYKNPSATPARWRRSDGPSRRDKRSGIRGARHRRGPRCRDRAHAGETGRLGNRDTASGTPGTERTSPSGLGASPEERCTSPCSPACSKEDTRCGCEAKGRARRRGDVEGARVRETRLEP